MIANLSSSRVTEAIILASLSRSGCIFGRSALYPALIQREDVCAIGPLTPPTDIDVAFVIDNNSLTECLKVGVLVNEMVVANTDTYVVGTTDQGFPARFVVYDKVYVLATTVLATSMTAHFLGAKPGDLKPVEFVPMSAKGLAHMQAQYHAAFGQLTRMDAKAAYDLWQHRYSEHALLMTLREAKNYFYSSLGIDYGREQRPDGNSDTTKLSTLLGFHLLSACLSHVP